MKDSELKSTGHDWFRCIRHENVYFVFCWLCMCENDWEPKIYLKVAFSQAQNMPICNETFVRENAYVFDEKMHLINFNSHAVYSTYVRKRRRNQNFRVISLWVMAYKIEWMGKKWYKVNAICQVFLNGIMPSNLTPVSFLNCLSCLPFGDLNHFTRKPSLSLICFVSISCIFGGNGHQYRVGV